MFADAAELRRRCAESESRRATQDGDGRLVTLAPTYRFTVGPTVIGGPPETVAGSRGVFATMPDHRQDVRRVLVEGDTVVVEAEGAGTVGTRTVRIPYVKILRFGRDGLVEDRQYHDPTPLTAARS